MLAVRVVNRDVRIAVPIGLCVLDVLGADRELWDFPRIWFTYRERGAINLGQVLKTSLGSLVLLKHTADPIPCTVVVVPKNYASN